MSSQKGAIPLLLLIAAVGAMITLGIASLAPVKNNLLSSFFPKQPTQAAIDEWAQDAHDAQRTGVTSEEPVTPWTFAWAFNGPDATGAASAHFQDAPREARIVTGGAHIYTPLGPKGLFALRKTDGSIAWNRTEASFSATPAYDTATQTVLAGGDNGMVYKIDSNSGTIVATYNAGSPINKSILLNGGFAYAVTDSGQLHKINIANMTSSWVYSANSIAQTPASYSPSRDAIIFATADLNVHAINNSNGLQKWKVKPTPNPPGFPNDYTYGWPVIAEKHGVVFIRMRLTHNANSAFPPNSTGNFFPTDLATTRAWLISNPQFQNLFALSLDDGSKKFIPAVGYGSTEDFINGGPYGAMGTQPIVRTYPDGTEVAYMLFRNGQSNPPDYRWDGSMGEMVLDDTTISGLTAGDLRFVKMNRPGGGTMLSQGGNSFTFLIDEQDPISMAGDTLFNAHFSASTAVKITDRTSSRGLTYTNPIVTQNLPGVMRAVKSCVNYNPATHYTTCGLTWVDDGARYLDGPGYWGYWNVVDPPGVRVDIVPASAGRAYSAGFLPRYTYVSDGQMIVEGNGGELLVFKHSGAVSQVPSPPSPLPSPSVSQTPSPTPPPISSPINPSAPPAKPGDIDGNNIVDIFDYNILLTNFGKTGTAIQGDLDGNNKVDIFDYNLLLTNFGK